MSGWELVSWKGGTDLPGRALFVSKDKNKWDYGDKSNRILLRRLGGERPAKAFYSVNSGKELSF